jgi:AraC-like DNA-binding protein
MAKLDEQALITAQAVEGEYYFPAFRSVVYEADERLEVICAGRERCFPRYRVERRDFPYFALEFVAHGRGALTLGNEKIELQAGSVFTYGPDVPHRLTAESEGMVKYFVDFSGPMAAQVLRDEGLAPGQFRVCSTRRWVTDLFDQLVACAELSRSEGAWYAGRLLELIIRRAGDETVGEAVRPGSSRETFEKCRRHLRMHAKRLMTVEQAADECAVSAAYMVRLFKQFARESAYEHLVRLKMDLAGDQLLLPGKTVKAAGAAVGYEDPYHFSRVFKRFHGLSPKAYRERFHRRSG